jgi:hypothetical protein
LDSVGKPPGQIIYKLSCMLSGTSANLPAGDKLCIRANRREGPNISETELLSIFFRNVPALRVTEAPYLIDLDALAVQVAEGLILVFGAYLSKIGKELEHSTLDCARHAARGADRIPLHQGGYDLRPLLCAKPVHQSWSGNFGHPDK